MYKFINTLFSLKSGLACNTVYQINHVHRYKYKFKLNQLGTVHARRSQVVIRYTHKRNDIVRKLEVMWIET